MYTLQSAYGLRSDRDSYWGLASVALLPVKQIFTHYRHLYLVLSNDLLTETVNVNAFALRDEFTNYEGNLADLFLEIGTRALPTVEAIPTYHTKWAIFSDAFSQGYKIDIHEPGRQPDGQNRRDNKTELSLTRPRLNTRTMFEHCLVTLNGYFYPTDYDEERVYVLNGGKSLLRSRRNQIGILSFQDVAQVEQIPLTKAMISKMGPSGKYSDEVVISVPPEHQHKSFILCLAGHLVFPNEQSLFKITDHDWLLGTADLPLVERYFESKNFIDYSKLNLTQFPTNPEKIDIEEFYSDAVMEEYITHEQSFLIIVDSPNLVRSYNHLRHSKLPGMFIAYEEPKSLLFVGRGRTAEYWKTYEDGQWAVNVVNSYLPNRTFDSVNARNRAVNAGTDTPHNLYYNSRGVLLNIGVDVLVQP